MKKQSLILMLVSALSFSFCFAQNKQNQLEESPNIFKTSDWIKTYKMDLGLEIVPPEFQESLWFQRVASLFEKCQFNEMIQELESLDCSKSNCSINYQLKSIAYYHLGQIDSAISNNLASLSTHKTYHNVTFQGFLFAEALDYEQAIKWYRKATTLFSQEAEPYYNLGLCLKRNGNIYD
ncbi:MAG: tetratricopeptide repeat protein, partial [Flavobacteriales bacterium]|nr:tetratricopeptide repeat protein [Flavobacteriales bacterium]